LRIGHGSKQENQYDKFRNESKDLTPEEVKLNEYSVSDYHERSFFTQVYVLAKKKILVMTRDRKSFIMDTIFPMILIVLGLYLT
jgi:hypothetical protein